MLLFLWIHFFVNATPVAYFAVAVAALAPARWRVSGQS
jgi:hypothetical protein